MQLRLGETNEGLEDGIDERSGCPIWRLVMFIMTVMHLLHRLVCAAANSGSWRDCTASSCTLHDISNLCATGGGVSCFFLPLELRRRWRDFFNTERDLCVGLSDPRRGRDGHLTSREG